MKSWLVYQVPRLIWYIYYGHKSFKLCYIFYPIISTLLTLAFALILPSLLINDFGGHMTNRLVSLVDRATVLHCTVLYSTIWATHVFLYTYSNVYVRVQRHRIMAINSFFSYPPTLQTWLSQSPLSHPKLNSSRHLVPYICSPVVLFYIHRICKSHCAFKSGHCLQSILIVLFGIAVMYAKTLHNILPGHPLIGLLMLWMQELFLYTVVALGSIHYFWCKFIP